MTRARLTHLDREGRAAMVDVGRKAVTSRRAIAGCEIQMKPETRRLLREGKIKKGDALTVAKVAGIMAAKKTSELIPLCHPLPLEHIDIRFVDEEKGRGLFVEAEVCTSSKTGVEMEALTAAAVAALTLYDMAKAVDPGIVISGLRLLKKTGGKNDYSNPNGDH